MQHLFDSFLELDQEILILLSDTNLDEELILEKIDIREEILNKMFQVLEEEVFSNYSVCWQDAIVRSNLLLDRMQQVMNVLGSNLKKYQHGKKSLKHYEQFNVYK